MFDAELAQGESVSPELCKGSRTLPTTASRDVQDSLVLSKAEIAEIVGADPGLALPLEAKFWMRQQLELFVQSGGSIRPRNCSMPDERLMVNIDMSEGDVHSALAQAAEWLSEADALLIGSGAGMGVDSGLGTFRGGHMGVWEGLEAVGLAYEEICDAKYFHEEPALAWAFWDHCYKAYKDTSPHEGYSLVRDWGRRCPLGYFSFTSNIDSHWMASGVGADRVLEVHGAVRWLQCSKPCCPDVWRAPKDHGLSMLPTHRVAGDLPRCPKCGACARPNVQMFGGDAGFSKARRAAQFAKYDSWLKSLEGRTDKDSLRVVCLEVGCGLTVPTVRKELEGIMSKFPQARLIRVNPENPGVPKELAKRAASLPLGAGTALEQLRGLVAAAAATRPAAAVSRRPEASPFTLERALCLQRELLEGFSAEGFQRRLQGLRDESSGPAGARRYKVERLQLLLTVHSEVLPRYGFEGNLTGVMDMMAAFTAPALLTSEEVLHLGALLEKLID